MASERPRPVLTAVTRGLCWSVAFALATMGVLSVGPTALVLAAIGAAMAVAVDGAVGGGRVPDRSRRQRMGRAARVAGTAIVGVLTLCGLAGLLGLAAVPVALLLGALGLALRSLRRGPAAPGDAGRVEVGDGGLARLDKHELAREWSTSYADLGRSGRDPHVLDQVAARRRLLLDEIERRDPEGFRRWAHTGEWVRSDAVPFLGTRGTAASPDGHPLPQRRERRGEQP